MVLLIVRTRQRKGIGSCEVFVSDTNCWPKLPESLAHLLVVIAYGQCDFKVIDIERDRITFTWVSE